MLAAAILAGGKSSRMGRNKALIRLGELTIIERIVQTTQKVCDEVSLITNTPQEFEFLRIPMFRDLIPDIGPLGGVYTALTHCAAPYCLVCGCDTPFITAAELTLLKDRLDSTHSIVAFGSEERAEPLCAIYAKTCLPEIEKRIQQKNYRLQDMLDLAGVRILDKSHYLTESESIHFFNINDREQLEQAKKMMRE